MTSSGKAALTRSHTNSDEYDHPIKLFDTTKPTDVSTSSPTDDAAESSDSPLSRGWTKDTLRKELAKRKYAKWQQAKGQVGESAEQGTGEIVEQGTDETNEASKATAKHEDGDESRSNLKHRGKRKKSMDEHFRNLDHQDQDSFIDVLYENQRGWFLFGMPLYSANSLLNLDPAPWQTSTFQDSAVNITNAQVPDPSWKWAWRTWYVDMSHDVDEEGWEYSFSFQSRFAWHGSHPWFHSFARRRRWLRKRVKSSHRDRIVSDDGKGAMKESHRLNADYFTIHKAKRDRSPTLSSAGMTRSSFLGFDGQESESEQDINDIPNVPALLAVLKKATVDRQKVVAVRTFLAQGGEELHYLPDSMDEILGLLIYQTSRQQVLGYIHTALQEVQRKKDSVTDQDEDVDQEAVTQTIKNLSRAIDTARSYLAGLEYWRDVSKADDSGSTVALAFGDDKDHEDLLEETKTHMKEENGRNDIRGIPKDAETDFAPSPLRTAHDQAEGPAVAGPVDKGKGREVD
ncbi:MAG: hypothetical protein Q9220_002147 [cf. Caloplaca sp. 1 TL-2023]